MGERVSLPDFDGKSRSLVIVSALAPAGRRVRCAAESKSCTARTTSTVRKSRRDAELSRRLILHDRAQCNNQGTAKTQRSREE